MTNPLLTHHETTMTTPVTAAQARLALAILTTIAGGQWPTTLDPGRLQDDCRTKLSEAINSDGWTGVGLDDPAFGVEAERAESTIEGFTKQSAMQNAVIGILDTFANDIMGDTALPKTIRLRAAHALRDAARCADPTYELPEEITADLTREDPIDLAKRLMSEVMDKAQERGLVPDGVGGPGLEADLRRALADKLDEQQGLVEGTKPESGDSAG